MRRELDTQHHVIVHSQYSLDRQFQRGTSSQNNLSKGRIATAHGSIMFARWRQCAPCRHNNAFLPPPSPQPKRRLDRFSRFAGFTIVTDRPTDHATPSVRIGVICVPSTALQTKNYRDCFRD